MKFYHVIRAWTTDYATAITLGEDLEVLYRFTRKRKATDERR
jgi:peptide chain release factor 2